MKIWISPYGSEKTDVQGDLSVEAIFSGKLQGFKVKMFFDYL